MIQCSACGRPIEKVPNWLSSVTAEFVCNNCPNRNTKNIAFMTLEPETPTVGRVDEEEEVDVEELPDDKDE